MTWICWSGWSATTFVHEVEELEAAPALGMLGLDRAGGDLESGKQRGRAAPLVFVCLAVERAAIGQLEIPLRPLQGLNRRLFIDREEDRMVGRIEVEADDVRSLGGKLGVARETPGFAPGEIDPLRPQKAPDVLVADVAEFLGEQRHGPARQALGRRPVEQCQDAPSGVRAVGLRLARARRIRQSGEALLREPHPPTADHAPRASDLPGDRPAAPAVAGKEHHPRPLHQTMLRLARAHPARQRGPLCRRQRDRRRFLYRHAQPVAWRHNLC